MTSHKTLIVALTAGLLALTAFLPAAGVQSGGDRFAWKDTIVVTADEVRNSVACFGGDVIIEGKVRKSVFAMGGTITVSGEVGEAVVGIGSRIIIKSSAVIKGDLVGLGGTIEKEPGFRVDGDTVYFKGKELSDRVFKNGVWGLVFFPFLPIFLIFKMVNVFLWILAAFLVAMLFPKQIVRASAQVRSSFWPSLGTGILALIVYVFLIVFSALLCVILIGIPILFALMMAGLAVKVFGRVVVFHFFGESLARSFKWSQPTALGAAFLGLLVVEVIGFIPILGSLFTGLVDALGWGLAVRTKFGTADNWFKKGAPLPPTPPAPPPPAPVPPPPAA
jgi:hypothetical protein